MKKKNFLKFIVIILCPLLLLSCSKEEDSAELPEEIENKTLLSVELPADYFPELANVDYSGSVYLTNDDGELISHGKINNGTITELQEAYDLTTGKLNLSFIRRIEHQGGISYRINTYNDIDPYEFIFENQIVRPRLGEANVQINNTGSPLQHYIYNYPTVTGSISQNEASFDIRLNREPEHLFFTVKKETENFRRYFLQKDVTTGTEITVDFQELPALTNQKRITFPENSNLFAAISGAENTEPNYFYGRFDEISATDGLSSHTFAIPDDIFQRFKLRLILVRDQNRYLLEEKSTSINEEYDFPDWDLQTSSEGTAYAFTSTDAVDYYRAVYRYVPLEEPYDIIWTVTGRKNEEMNFNLPELGEFIAQDIPGFSLEDLDPHAASLIKVEGLSTYKEFIMSQEDNYSSENDKITKFEDLSFVL